MDKHILVVKTSSMGDVLHTLPAITDALLAMPDLHIDWVVEEAFAPIPSWHPGVENVIPVAIRRWRKELRQAWRQNEIQDFWRDLRAKDYDLVIDAQGLIKSAVVTRCTRGVRCGLDRHSAKEGVASFAYQKRCSVPTDQHAINRVRQLFAESLGYSVDLGTISYGLEAVELPPYANAVATPYLVFLHGTSWDTKQWPTSGWKQLVAQATGQGFDVWLPWGCESEKQTAESIARDFEHCRVLPKLGLDELAILLHSAAGVVGLDTGLCHMAAAFGVPTLAIYGATDPKLTGVLGPKQQNLAVDYDCAPCLKKQCHKMDAEALSPPCYSSISADVVWQHFSRLLDNSEFSQQAIVAAKG